MRAPAPAPTLERLELAPGRPDLMLPPPELLELENLEEEGEACPPTPAPTR